MTKHMHPSEYIANYPIRCAQTGHHITETRFAALIHRVAVTIGARPAPRYAHA